MKGPGLRLDLEVRRLWRCPTCGVERRVPARQVTVTCGCTDSGTFMQLIEPKRAVRAEPPPLDPFLDIELEPSERRQRPPEVETVSETVEAPPEPAIKVPGELVTPPPEAASTEVAKPKETSPSEPRKSEETRNSGSPPTEDSPEKKKSRGRRRGRGGRGNRRRRGGRGRGGDSGGSSAPSSDKS
ncbi:hypothetical protein Mal4_24730 [Maioricimonas rarisocia]|uniref:Uncharacterized protein n=1 Tax=Maioricimonas rarisocia TaxID=2528026 RepID=A0A517Z6M2_9PLAN|nr:hypothetical protein [Maioricimonas rarisocia]QDU38150.1 hypothetical protein Mal4_24730 [Maioricimonas rarisocia]